ncbi:MAG TPA: glycosyltransferase family 4 protein [Alphaproteobacteria bacterium]|nr:glycosyltransferase family 4 protein [Alphaproteobacteria bacterium]
MADAIFAIPGDIAAKTGGYAYDRRLLELLPAQGLNVRHARLPDSFPFPSAADLAATAQALAATPSGSAILFDGLAYGALPADLIRAIERPIVAIVHHPLSYEPGPSDGQRRAFLDSERRALAVADAVVVSSSTTRGVLAAEFGVNESRIAVAEPGTERVPRARGSSDVPSLLAVGAVSVRKGYGVLVDALAGIANRPWTATVVGTLDRDPETAAGLARRIAQHGLTERIPLAGEVADDALSMLYDTADIFLMPSLYEGYGMALAEAMARGLPIVCTTGGAAAETAPGGAALKVPPGDTAAFGAATARLLDDAALRKTVADTSWRAGQELPNWDQTAVVVARVVRGVLR